MTEVRRVREQDFRPGSVLAADLVCRRILPNFDVLRHAAAMGPLSVPFPQSFVLPAVS